MFALTIESEGVGLIGVLLTFAVGFLGWRQKRDENQTNGCRDLIDNLQEELTRLRAVAEDRERKHNELYDEQVHLHEEIDELRQQFRQWVLGTRLLITQLRDLGHEPVWVPDEQGETA